MRISGWVGVLVLVVAGLALGFVAASIAPFVAYLVYACLVFPAIRLTPVSRVMGLAAVTTSAIGMAGIYFVFASQPGHAIFEANRAALEASYGPLAEYTNIAGEARAEVGVSAAFVALFALVVGLVAWGIAMRGKPAERTNEEALADLSLDDLEKKL